MEPAGEDAQQVVSEGSMGVSVQQLAENRCAESCGRSIIDSCTDYHEASAGLASQQHRRQKLRGGPGGHSRQLNTDAQKARQTRQWTPFCACPRNQAARATGGSHCEEAALPHGEQISLGGSLQLSRAVSARSATMLVLRVRQIMVGDPHRVALMAKECGN